MGEVSSGVGSGTTGDMSNKPAVTIITIYHNRRDHVVDSIQSLINQTYDNSKIVIVDDCSNDDTYELLKETINNSRRTELRKNEFNKGFTQTLIDTINELDSEFIAIHGAGDISLPTRIEEQVNHLLSNPEVGVVTVDITNIKKPKFHKTEITLKDLLQKNRITHGAVMFKKEIYDQVGGYRSFFTTRQDKDLWFRMSLVTKIHFLSNKLYKLINIESSVSKFASKNGIPLLLSVFAEELIKERKKNNVDLLDIYGNKGAIFFNPNKANKLILFNAVYSLYKGDSNKALSYLYIMNTYNKSIFLKILLKMLSPKKLE